MVPNFKILNAKYDFETLDKRFIEAYSKIGIKHNTITQILSFKQKDGETVRQCVDRLQQYIARCPEKKTPSQECLISCFLEGLKDRQLYMHLFCYTDFDDCCFEAQKFDDNCDNLHNKASCTSSISGEMVKNVDSNALVDMIVRRLRPEPRSNPPYR